MISPSDERVREKNSLNSALCACEPGQRAILSESRRGGARTRRHPVDGNIHDGSAMRRRDALCSPPGQSKLTSATNLGTAMARGWHSWTRTLLLGTTATPADALAHPLTLASTTRHFYPLAPVNHRRWARLWVRRHQHDTSDRRVPADPPRIADATPNPALVDLDASLSSTATSTTDAIAFLLRSTLTALHRPRPLLHAAQDSLPDQRAEERESRTEVA
ncbi:hypothetical protein RTBOTA2_000092 [Rhodotorula toruloides]|nr:hypothetical protein RTBOTA2_000092 [Rhodotorula toruloides]